MANYDFQPSLDQNFIGRDTELRWLNEAQSTRMGWGRPIIISGLGGIGKTALLKQFLAKGFSLGRVVWFDADREPHADADLAKFISEVYSLEPRTQLIVVIDGAESLSDEQIKYTTERLFNLKAVRSVLLASRRTPNVGGTEVFELESLSSFDAARLLRAFLSIDLAPETIENAVRTAQGHPLAILLLAGILKSGRIGELPDLLDGRIYDLSKVIAVPSTKLITSVVPRIVTAKEALLEELKKQPRAIFELPPRKFEELLAELLTDMGWEVELTKATRDGGKDILAYLKTDVGKLLCLVEAKRYQRDHKVGVELVRSLYGTLCDYQANSAMLVTTSSFSRDAREFQKKHEYQLALKDYGDVVQWIQRYKQNESKN
jgi:restriction system protein